MEKFEDSLLYISSTSVSLYLWKFNLSNLYLSRPSLRLRRHSLLLSNFGLESTISSSLASASLIVPRLLLLDDSQLRFVIWDELGVREWDEELLSLDLEVVNDSFSLPLPEVLEVDSVVVLPGVKVFELGAVVPLHRDVPCRCLLGIGESERHLLGVAVLG